jgi:hypothetical protein
MKRIAYASLAVLLVVCSYASLSADASSRPPGVAEKNWLPVSDRLGIVLAERAGPTTVNPHTLLLTPPIGGYFMLKGPAGWTRLVVIEPNRGPGGAG